MWGGLCFLIFCEIFVAIVLKSADKKYWQKIPKFDGPDSSTKFRWNRSKIKGTNTSEVIQAQNGQKQGWAPKNYP